MRQKKVDGITWFGNGMLLVLGGVSFTNEGVWFKLQPAILELMMGGFLIVSVFMKKPVIAMMAEKQGTFARLPEPLALVMKKQMAGLTFRVGVFFLLHCILAVWAALHWSTRAWAILKGVGFTGSLFLYMGVEAVLLRRRLPHPPQQ